MPTEARTLKLDPGVFAQPIELPPGQEVRFKGSYRASDGSTIDAATTSWPEGSPGGAGVDAGGFVDFAGGGLKLSARDPVTHEVVAITTGGEAPACSAAGVASPCVALRTVHLARSRFMTREELRSSLQGEITIELVAPPPPPAPPPPTPVRDAVTSPLALVLAAMIALFAAGALGFFALRRRARSPAGQMRTLIARVHKKLAHADAGLAAALDPVVKKTLAALSARRIDPASREGVRIAQVLTMVEQRIDDSARRVVEEREQRAADELVLEMESALEAAQETATL